jgi:hypothetical protein
VKKFGSKYIELQFSIFLLVYIDAIYSFPVFTKDFCTQIIAEIKHFEASPMPKGRPNTMNNYGV